MSIDTYQVRKIEPPPTDFLMTPEQHRWRAQDMRNAGRPDLAKHHEILAQAIERRRRGRPNSAAWSARGNEAAN
jgi:propanediol dehydratase small subunit